MERLKRTTRGLALGKWTKIVHFEGAKVQTQMNVKPNFSTTGSPPVERKPLNSWEGRAREGRGASEQGRRKGRRGEVGGEGEGNPKRGCLVAFPATLPTHQSPNPRHAHPPTCTTLCLQTLHYRNAVATKLNISLVSIIFGSINIQKQTNAAIQRLA